MRNVFSILIAAGFLFCLAGCNGGLKNGTPEELGESIFLSLKNNDYEGFRSLFPVESDVDEILEKQGEDGGGMSREKAMKRLQDSEGKIKENFEELRAEIADAGVEIGSAAWEGVDVKKREAEKNIEVVDLKVYFKGNDQSVELRIRAAGKLNRGWLMDRGPRMALVN